MAPLRFRGRNYFIANADENGIRRVHEGASFIGDFVERDGYVCEVRPTRENETELFVELAKTAELAGMFKVNLQA